MEETTVTSAKNPLIQHLIKLRKSREYRYDSGSLVVMGIKMVTELARHTSFISLLHTPDVVPPACKADKMVTVSPDLIKKISKLSNPEGLIAEVPLPLPSNLQGCRRLLALDQINDPGNLGTLMRTAYALGWEGIFLLTPCVDPFNDKALRAAKGATFHLPYQMGTWEDLEKVISRNGLTPYVAHIEGDSLASIDMISEKILLILGNEAHGPSKETFKRCLPLSIPMRPEAESLNVASAGSIFLYFLNVNARKLK